LETELFPPYDALLFGSYLKNHNKLANHDFALKLAKLIDDIVFYTSAKFQ